MNEDQKKEIRKILSGITFCALSTCSEGEPHTTIVPTFCNSLVRHYNYIKEHEKKD